VLPKAEPPPSELTERGVDGCCNAPPAAAAAAAALLALPVMPRRPSRLVLLPLGVMWGESKSWMASLYTSTKDACKLCYGSSAEHQILLSNSHENATRLHDNKLPPCCIALVSLFACRPQRNT
jgi:hypothetical protein